MSMSIAVVPMLAPLVGGWILFSRWAPSVIEEL